MQAGSVRHGGVADHDVGILAYAGQVNLDMDWRPVRARVNGMVFSGEISRTASPSTIISIPAGRAVRR